MATSQNLAGKPSQRWMVRDYQIRNSVSSVTSEDGHRIGLVVPSSSNMGGLAPIVLGDPNSSTESTITLQLVNSGSLTDARWIWKSNSDGIYHGWNSDLYMWGFHAPAGAGNQGATIVYSSIFRRIVVITVDSPSIRVSYITLTTRPNSSTDWQSLTFSPTNTVDTNQHALAACELRDGTLLLLVRRSVDGDFDLYRSSDGGATWSLATRSLVFSQLGFTSAGAVHGVNDPSTFDTFITPRMAASGDWVRIVVGTNTGSLLTWTSSDSGASWQYSGLLTAAVDIDSDLSAVQTNDIQPFALVGVDETTGAFALIANPAFAGDTNKIHLWYATRDNAWSNPGDLFSSPTIDTTPRSYMAWTDPYYLWVWCYAVDTAINDGWYAFRCPRDRILDSGSWEGVARLNPDTSNSPQTFDQNGNATRLSPSQVTAIWADDRVAVVGYLQDQEGSVPLARKASRPWVAWIGGWTAKPWSSDYIRSSGYSTAIHWAAIYGQPAGGDTSSVDTTWSYSSAVAGTASWNAQVYVECSATGASNLSFAKFTENVDNSSVFAPPRWDYSSSTAYIWASEFVAAVGNTSPASSSLTGNGVEWKVPSTGGGGYGWTATCKLGTNQAILYIGANPVATLSGLAINTAESNVYHRFRFVVSPAASPTSAVGILQYKQDNADTWTSSSTFNVGLATSSSITQTSMTFGILGPTPVATGTILSRWREVRMAHSYFEPDYTTGVASNVPGAYTSSRPRGLTSGSTADTSRLRVAWGGTGGVNGDSWSHSLDHDYPATAVTVESPSVFWRSASAATYGTKIVFDACGATATSDSGSRWMHTAIALFGLENLQTTVTYSDDSSGLVNAVVAATVTPTQYTGVRVSQASGRWLTLTRPSGSWREGDLNGRLVKVTATSGAGVNRIYKIERHVYDGTNHRVELALGGQFDPTVVGAGDTLTIFGSNAYASYGTAYAKRYMTLTFGLTGDNNWSGRWTLGTVVPGVERTFSPPLLWTHTVTENPYVTVQRARGGQSWAYQDAPTNRTWTGRWMGANGGERQGFRDSLKYLARWAEEPCVILLDAEKLYDQDRSILLARYVDAIDMDNYAFYRTAGSTSQAWAVGDLAVNFQEIT